MTALSRGDVVRLPRDASGDGRRAVVWVVGASRLVLLPVEDGAIRFAGDVPVEADADRLTFATRRFAVIRTSKPFAALVVGQVRLGQVSAELLGQLVPAARRASESAAWVQVWGAEKRHRSRAFQERSALR